MNPPAENVTSDPTAATDHDLLTRRKMLMGLGTAAVLTSGLLSKVNAQQSGSTSSSSGSNSAKEKPTDPDPFNPPLQSENPDSFDPPSTDSGDVNSFKYSFELGHNKVSDGGWARQVTVRDLPVSKIMAGVDMRLKRGAVRELHWHVSAEWAFMLKGEARLTAVNSDGTAFVDDVGVGDLWYFPSGVPHSIQGIGSDGCEFLLVFDDGAFSEFDTFLITDWMHHTPPSVLAKNFNLPEETFKDVPPHELYIFNAPMPPSLQADRKAAFGPENTAPVPFTFKLSQMAPTKKQKGGEVRIVDSSLFKASITIASALVTLEPGGLRELHWHPNADEWQFYIGGKGRMTSFPGGGKARTMDFQKGDVGVVQQSLGHYIENTGDEPLVFLEMFKSSFYQDISLGQWISHLPPELVSVHLKIPEDIIKKIPREKLVITPA